MRFDQLIYLVEIVKYGSISTAAENLHVSQPTISQAIQALEDELEIKIFNRSRLGTYPTEDGKVIINKARHIINLMTEIKDFNNKEYLTGNLSIGSIPSVSIGLLPKTLAMFREKHPGVNMDITEGGSEQITDHVLAGKVDLGLIAVDRDETFSKDLIIEPIIKTQFMACVGKKSPLASRSSITMKEISDHPIITYNQHYKLFSYVYSILNQYGDPDLMLKSGNTETAKSILYEGIGIGFCNTLSISYDPYFQSGMLIPIPITDIDTERLAICSIRLSNHLPAAGQEFLKELDKSKENFELYSNLQY